MLQKATYIQATTFQRLMKKCQILSDKGWQVRGHFSPPRLPNEQFFVQMMTKDCSSIGEWIRSAADLDDTNRI